MIYCQLKINSEAIKLLIETKGAVPKSYMHALKDNLKLNNENEQLKKITKDYTHVRKLIEENQHAKKLTKEHWKLGFEKDQYFQKITKDAWQIKNLVEENDQNRMLAYKNQKLAIEQQKSA